VRSRARAEDVCPQARGHAQGDGRFFFLLDRSELALARGSDRALANNVHRLDCSARKLLGRPARKDRGSRGRWNQLAIPSIASQARGRYRLGRSILNRRGSDSLQPLARGILI
jgi:hypothetical protein